MESWHILSPLDSGTSSIPINFALKLVPGPRNRAAGSKSIGAGLPAVQDLDFNFQQNRY